MTPNTDARIERRWVGGERSPWVWAAASLTAFLIIGATTAIAFAQGPRGAMWALFAGLAVLACARLVFGRWLPVPVAAAAVLIAGVALAGAVDGTLRDWAVTRFGYFDPEFLGPTSLFFAVVAGVAVAGFGALIAPPRAVLPAAIAVAGGAALTILVLIGNVGGLRDGLDPESIGPAVAMGLACAYVLIVAVVSLRRLLPSASVSRQ